MTDTALAAKIVALAAILGEREEAKKAKPEDNPYAKHTLADLSHGLAKGADNIPALNMVAKAETSAAQELEGGRFATAEEGRKDKTERRKITSRARAQRKIEFDKIAESKAQPSEEQMLKAWRVVYWLVPIVHQIAKSKQRWANRLLGSNADDIPQMALEKMALLLANQEQYDLDVLRKAAKQLNKRHRGIPGNQKAKKDASPKVKQVMKARKWLMGAINNRVQGALVDSFTSAHHLKWDNLDIITTVMASINGVGDDPMLARFLVDRAPAFLGTRMARPGGINPDVLAMAIAAAITEKGLDPLTEFLLDDDHRRTDGAVEWSKHARSIFLLTPGDYGQWLWDEVCRATENHARKKNDRGIAAMNHVRNLFEWLPGLIVSVVDSVDPHPIGWGLSSEMPVYTPETAVTRHLATVNVNLGSGVIPSPNPAFENTVGQPVGDEAIEEVEVVWHTREPKERPATRVQAVMASDFELFYLPDEPARTLFEPALRYGSVEEAAEALTEYLANLTTWQDWVMD